MFDFLKKLDLDDFEISRLDDMLIQNLWASFRECTESEAAEEFLQLLLTLMMVMFRLNRDYRQNIQDFNGRYQFLSKDGEITVAAIFRDGRMEVREAVIPDPHITITFRDGRALFNYLISPRQDIIGSILRHDVETDGNLNYLYRFGYLAKQLLEMAPGQ
ncbi:hypothetical protein GF1_12220 [Desulfolithobacter dissulfuricans]|uniref:SCP2 domain-containing protein n=1 Tax=Desulfolithobacter dissulfuricans TaxID=2795293 RepID=A0A915XKX6_9BACT|nr:hypothetical protein [Desulfolithobacter dissulfuricans]BCO08846.1 hypothetical protein GF1_12220 [Desulfolithobacter dissulfuricans]